MSQRVASAFMVLAVLAACGGNPWTPEAEPVEPTPTEPNGNQPEQLPGTTTPTAASAIVRYEDRDDNTGNGYAEAISYDPATGRFSVDNLAFDGGENLYTLQDTTAWNLGPYQFYEAAQVATDEVSGRTIPQFEHRLLAGFSKNRGRTEFAIVRTGAYMGYGFGGFVLRRNSEGVVMPTSGQAAYAGSYAGIQDFNGRGGLRYTTGAATIYIDFNDFNNGDGVRGYISDRRVFDVNGNDITSDVIAQFNQKFDPLGKAATPTTELPTIIFKVGPGVIDANGEIRGFLNNTVVNYGETPEARPEVVEYEAGNYYAIVAGPQANEVVGIIVVESEDLVIRNAKQRETGGFIAYRE